MPARLALLRHDPPASDLERRLVVTRPEPPSSCAEDEPETFVPAPDFAEWITGTFLNASGPLANEDHAHLLDATIGVLWTNAIHVRQMRTVLATAEIPTIQAGGWKRSRFEWQLRQWFDTPLDFLLTFSGPDCARLDDRAFCALVEHELSHCAQAVDRYGAPKFHRETGRPIFAIRGHDCEEFVGVVRRYGVTSPDVRAMVDAASQTPVIAGGPIAIACGTCLERAA